MAATSTRRARRTTKLPIDPALPRPSPLPRRAGPRLLAVVMSCSLACGPPVAGAQPGLLGPALRGTVRIPACVGRHPKVPARWNVAARRALTRRCYRGRWGAASGDQAQVACAGYGLGAVGCAELAQRSEEHTSELQSPDHLVCRLLLEKKKKKICTRINTQEYMC